MIISDTLRRFVEIAHDNGFSVRHDRVAVRDHLRYALMNHLQPRSDGKRVDAFEYFGDYLQGEAWERGVEERAYNDFHDRAYGRD